MADIQLASTEWCCHRWSVGDSERQEASVGALLVDVLPPARAMEEGQQQVDIHKPTPVHSWRELLSEIGVIVIGVLIALAGEQAVEWLHWNHTIEEQRKALDRDVRDAWDAMSARVVIGRCIDTRLDELKLVLARHARHAPLDIVRPIGRPAVWTASQAALQMASGDGSLAHMSLNEKSAYFDVAESFNTFFPAATEERLTWRTLELLDDPEALDEADWRDVRHAYLAARDSNRGMKANLISDRPGHWLYPFRRFPVMPENKGAFRVPVVSDLCRSAVRR